ncbi:MAG: FHA domain-containing protein [Nannocystaceae bacterium]
MGVEVTIFDPSEGSVVSRAFDHSPVRIGRDPDSDLCLNFPFVSVRHALIHFDGDRVDFVDVGSRNGTLRGGRPLPPHQPITVGEHLVVTIGRVELTIRRDPPARVTGPVEAAQELARVHALLRALLPLHDEVVRARAVLVAEARSGLDALSPRSRELAEAMIARELPYLRDRGSS